MISTPQHVMVSALEGGHAYDAVAAKGWVVVPVLHIAAEGKARRQFHLAQLYIAGDENPPRADIARLRAVVPEFHFGHVVGSGHFCQLEVPAQVNAMIDRFLALVSP